MTVYAEKNQIEMRENEMLMILIGIAETYNNHCFPTWCPFLVLVFNYNDKTLRDLYLYIPQTNT